MSIGLVPAMCGGCWEPGIGLRAGKEKDGLFWVGFGRTSALGQRDESALPKSEIGGSSVA